MARPMRDQGGDWPGEGGASAARADKKGAAVPPTLALATPDGRLLRRARFVRTAKLTLSAAALALTAAVILWPRLAPQNGRFRIGFADLDMYRDELSMVNARYVGTDRQNRPYTISAESVRNLFPGGKEMLLDAPQADITLGDGTWVMLAAEHGEYSVKDKSLVLNGSVKLFHDDGYEIHTDQANVDLDAGVVSGSTPVYGQGPLGTLTAEGFRLTDSGKVVVFTGKSKLVIFPTALRRK